MSTIDVPETEESKAAYAIARQQFEAFAAGWREGVVDDPSAKVQCELIAWQTEHYGIVSQERQALGIIEEMTETIMACDSDDEPTENALDGLGDVCVYASNLATNNRLAIGPILDLARVYTQASRLPGRLSPQIGTGMLAQCVLKGAQKIRGMADLDVYRSRLVRAIAMCIARTVDDIEMTQAIVVDIRDIFEIVANEVMKRGQGHPSIPVTTGTSVTPVGTVSFRDGKLVTE